MRREVRRDRSVGSRGGFSDPVWEIDGRDWPTAGEAVVSECGRARSQVE